MLCFFFNDTSTTEIYTYCHTLSLHDALPIYLANSLLSLLTNVSPSFALPLAFRPNSPTLVAHHLQACGSTVRASRTRKKSFKRSWMDCDLTSSDRKSTRLNSSH